MKKISEYKGIVNGFPEAGKKAFYMELVLFMKTDILPAPIEDEELKKLLSNIRDKNISVTVGDYDEDFEEYVESIDEMLAEENITPFYTIRIQRGLRMDDNGIYITKDDAPAPRDRTDVEEEMYTEDMGEGAQDMLTYIENNYYIYRQK